MYQLNSDYISVSVVCLHLELSTHTIKRWYKWWECDSFDKPKDLYLPPYFFRDRRKTKYFKREDLAALEEFKTKIQTTHRGVMAEFNAAFQWGKRGANILKTKNMTKKEVQQKMR